MNYHNVWSQTNFENFIVQNMGICSDCEELFRSLDSIACYNLFIAKAYACVPIVVLKVFNNEFLTDVYHFVDSFAG